LPTSFAHNRASSDARSALLALVQTLRNVQMGARSSVDEAGGLDRRAGHSEKVDSEIEIRRCIANSEGLTTRLSGSRVGELSPRLLTGCVHLAPQNAPQIASRAVFSRRLALSLFLVKCYVVVSRRLVKRVLTLSHG